MRNICSVDDIIQPSLFELIKGQILLFASYILQVEVNLQCLNLQAHNHFLIFSKLILQHQTPSMVITF